MKTTTSNFGAAKWEGWAKTHPSIVKTPKGALVLPTLESIMAKAKPITKANKKVQHTQNIYDLKKLFRLLVGEPKLPDYCEDSLGYYSGYYQGLEDIAKLLLTAKGVTWIKHPNISTPPKSQTPAPVSGSSSTST